MYALAFPRKISGRAGAERSTEAILHKWAERAFHAGEAGVEEFADALVRNATRELLLRVIDPRDLARLLRPAAQSYIQKHAGAPRR